MIDANKSLPVTQEGKEDKTSSGSGTFTGYTLEARLRTMHSYVCSPEFILTKEWKQVPMGPGATFRCELWEWTPHARQLGLVDYAVAKGIAAQMHAQFRQANWGMEFRLVRHKVAYTYAEKEIQEGQPFDFGWDTERLDFPKPEPSKDREEHV